MRSSTGGFRAFAAQSPALGPDRVALDLAKVDFLSSSGVAILVGQGALRAGAEVEKVAEVLAAPVIKALLGKAVIPDDSPYTTGGLGLVGTVASEKAMEECDSLLIVGSSFPYERLYPKPGQARCVQIDFDARRLGLRPVLTVPGRSGSMPGGEPEQGVSRVGR